MLGPALARAGHEVADGREDGPCGCDAAIDFTRPDAVLVNAARTLEARVPLRRGDDRLRHGGARPHRARCGSPVPLRAELRARRGADDALRRGRLPSAPARGDRRAPRRDEARRAFRNGEGDGGTDGRRRRDPLRAPSRPRGAPGGAPRWPGGDADDPPRHDVARGVRAWRAPSGGGRAGSPARPDRRSRAGLLSAPAAPRAAPGGGAPRPRPPPRPASRHAS